MKQKIKRTICTLQSFKNDQNFSPILIMPRGLVTSQKGEFVVDEESYTLMKEHLNGRGIDVVVDYEHQTLENVQAPAAGWIKDIILKEDGIWAEVEWTAKAEEYLKNKEYRYLSPVIMVRTADKKAIELHSVALTNTPAINSMRAIVNKLDDENQEDIMELEKLAMLLGLSEDATEEQVEAAIKELLAQKKANETTEEVVANKTILTLLNLKENAKTEDVASAIMNLSNNDAARELKALKEKIAKDEAEQLVEKGLSAGKITPNQKEWALSYALKDTFGFQKFLEMAPQMVPMGESKTMANSDKPNMSEEIAKVYEQLGIQN